MADRTAPLLASSGALARCSCSITVRFTATRMFMTPMPFSSRDRDQLPAWPRRVDSMVLVQGWPVGGLPVPQPLLQVAEALAVLGHIDRLDARADDRRPGRLQSAGAVERRLPAKLDDEALRL